MKKYILLTLILFGSLNVAKAGERLTLTEIQQQQLFSLEPLEASLTQPTPLADKPMLVTFFASWCPPCTAEFRELKKLQQVMGPDQVNILAINLFEDLFPDPGGKRLSRFVDRTEPEFALLQAPSKDQISKLFGSVERIPTVFIFDPKGQEIYRFIHEEGASKRNSSYEEMKAVLINRSS